MTKNRFIRFFARKELIASLLAVYSYFFMEWLFLVTMPSFMASLDLLQKLKILLIPSLVIGVIIMAITALLIVVSDRMPKISWSKALVPAVIYGLLSFILLDNFTYTLFKIGVVTSKGIPRLLYAVFVIASILYFTRSTHLQFSQKQSRKIEGTTFLILGLFFLSIAAFITEIPALYRNNASKLDPVSQSISIKPNIILIGFDGVNASEMSAYGYDKKTTPNIEALSKNALVMENAFSNAGKTYGALTAILTGKNPLQTKVISPPDILEGNDAYQHFPGILKQLGYASYQITFRPYADAYSQNIKNGFDIANQRKANVNPLFDNINNIDSSGSLYFSTLVYQRLTERLEHVFFIKPMENPFKMVNKPEREISQKKLYNDMIDYIQTSDKPVFVHVHMMVTHGPMFSPDNLTFSSGETQSTGWMTNFYDDAILESDRYFGELFSWLENSNRLDNTIVILYSDHGIEWNPKEKIPLMFWFPKGRYAGKIENNVQLIDIAPTLLDYLNIKQPAWMHGDSLIAKNFNPAKSIFIADVAPDNANNGENSTSAAQTVFSPPFYQLGRLDLIVCSQWFSLDLGSPSITSGTIAHSTVKCPASEIPSPEQAAGILVQKLKDSGYDISALPASIPVK